MSTFEELYPKMKPWCCEEGLEELGECGSSSSSDGSMSTDLRSSTCAISIHDHGCETYYPTNLVVQTGPEAVIDVSTSAFLDDKPAETILQSVYTIIECDSWFWDPIRVRHAIVEGTGRITYITFFLSLRSLLFVLLNLGVQARHYTLQTA
jgi:hypothetical protein